MKLSEIDWLEVLALTTLIAIMFVLFVLLICIFEYVAAPILVKVFLCFFTLAAIAFDTWAICSIYDD